MDKVLVNNENKVICSACNGKCCRNMGCHCSPEDIGEITFETILEFINTGNFSIDWWEGDVLDKNRDKTYYLRARNIDAGTIDPSWGGRCKLLTPTGCLLPFEKRPKGGRAVTPVKTFDCKGDYSKKECCVDWYPYQNILDEVVDHIRYIE
jgi:hypothetical protein